MDREHYASLEQLAPGDRYLEHADAVLRVLAEHGDTQQVREEVIAALHRFSIFFGPGGMAERVTDEVIVPIVAPRLAAAVEREQNLHQVVTEWHDRAERAEADLTAARLQLDQVRTLHSKPTVIVGSTALPIIYEKTRRILDAPARHDETGQ
jgi:hypothetical protein